MLSGIIGGSLGLIGVIISLFFSFKLNKNNQSFQKDLMKKDQEYKLWEKKYNALIQMISYRYDVKSPEYTSAMNGAIAVFHDSKPVMNSIKKFYEYLSNDNRDPARANEKMVEIYIAMYEDLGIASILSFPPTMIDSSPITVGYFERAGKPFLFVQPSNILIAILLTFILH